MLAKAKGLDPDDYVAEQMGTISLPPAYRYLWNLFRRLANRRQYTDGNPLSISFSEMESYSRLTRTPLDAWEVSIIEALDDHERSLILDEISKRRQQAERRR
jgi:hypothetical protein